MFKFGILKLKGGSKSALFGMITGTIAIILTSLAVSSILSTQVRSKEVEAKVVGSGSLCTQLTETLSNGRQKIYPNCQTHVEYKIKDVDDKFKIYLNKINTKADKYNSGDKFMIYYNPDDPNDISYNEIILSKIGSYLLIIVVFLILIIKGYDEFIS